MTEYGVYFRRGLWTLTRDGFPFAWLPESEGKRAVAISDRANASVRRGGGFCEGCFATLAEPGYVCETCAEETWRRDQDDEREYYRDRL